MKAFIGNSEVHQVAMLEFCGVRVNVGVPTCRQSAGPDIMMVKVLKIETLSPPEPRFVDTL